MSDPVNPWNALWAMLLGFFVILVDSTIVAVANPSIMVALGVGYDTVIWVTSSYLLAYAVPLLVAGRLGDRFGPKNLYLIGLAVFTGASLWCGLSGGIEMLIIARAVQGLGAALLTPQTLSVITRTFPADRRGMAMAIWGATAGVATLVGPLVGGVLVDHLGWTWIFFVNVPIGVVGLVMAVVLIPDLPIQRHRFDLIGMVLSGIGLFLVVFALQEGESQGWALWIWALIGGGLLFLAVFVYWQAVMNGEPLVPLHIFRDLDFGLSNIGVAVIGFAATAIVLPVMFYAQVVCGMSPTRSALLTAPMSIVTGILAPVVGKIVDRAHPRTVVGFGFSLLAIALTWLSFEMTPVTPIWRLLLPFAAMGGGMAFIWSPLAATATRNLPPELAGAGSGVYNATRQVGAVLGSAGMAAFMTSRIATNMPPMPGGPGAGHPGLHLPEFLHEPFSTAMSESALLPAFISLFGVAAALFMVGHVFGPGRRTAGPEFLADAGLAEEPRPVKRRVERVSIPRRFAEVDVPHGADRPTMVLPRLTPMVTPMAPFTPVAAVPSVAPAAPVARPVRVRYEDPITEPLTRNGFHVEAGQHFRPVVNGTPVPDVLAKFGITGQPSKRRNRHYREDPDDTDRIGRRI